MRMMMENKKVVLICSIVGFLGLVSAALGFAAEGTKIKISQVSQDENGICIYPKSSAFPLGFTSAMALLIAQIIINGYTGCICCRSNPLPSNAHWRLALVCFTVSWSTFVLAFLLLLSGAALNNQHSAESVYLGYNYCYVVKPGVFSGASLMSFVSIILGLVCYIILTNEKNTTGPSAGSYPPNQSNIAMGHPQVPPVSHVPVFVHEDAYTGRQYT